MSPLAHSLDCLHAAPSYCRMRSSPDAEFLTQAAISDIAGIAVRRHICTFLGYVSSPDSRVHVLESKMSSMATLRLLVGFSLHVLHRIDSMNSPWFAAPTIISNAKWYTLANMMYLRR